MLIKIFNCFLLAIISLILFSCSDNKPKESFPTPKVERWEMKGVDISKIAPIKFPEDEAMHDVLTEWWYYAGHFYTTDGVRYGVMFVIAKSMRGQALTFYMCNFGINDTQNHKYRSVEKIEFSDPKNEVYGGTNGFKFDFGSWKLSGKDGIDHLEADTLDGAYAVNLQFEDIKGIALPSNGPIAGVISFAPLPLYTYYYEKPRMKVSGTITVNGHTKQIRDGLFWFDKQWGSFFTQAKWQWFFAQLDDGSDLMAYSLDDKRYEKNEKFGIFVPSCTGKMDCGRNKIIPCYNLKTGDFTVSSAGEWVSPVTGIHYPINWTLNIKGNAILPSMNLLYTPLNPDSEIRHPGRPDMYVFTYSENDCTISGTMNNKPITGNGFVELSGYAS